MKYTRSQRPPDRFSLLVKVYDEPDGSYVQLRSYFHDLGHFFLFVDTDGAL